MSGFGNSIVGSGVQNCGSNQYESETYKSCPIDVVLTFENNGEPVVGEEYCVTQPDGSQIFGYLDSKGAAKVSGIICDEGESCDVTFPNLDSDAWDDG